MDASRLGLVQKRSMPSHLTKSFTLRTEQLFPNRPALGWTVTGQTAPLCHLCLYGYKSVIPTAMHMP